MRDFDVGLVEDCAWLAHEGGTNRSDFRGDRLSRAGTACAYNDRGFIVLSARNINLACICTAFVACVLNPHPLPPEDFGATSNGADAGAISKADASSTPGAADVDAGVAPPDAPAIVDGNDTRDAADSGLTDSGPDGDRDASTPDDAASTAADVTGP